MSSGGKVPVTIRRGTPEDIEPILDLLTEYGLPRSYFEPFFLNDTSYRPEQSWVVEQNGRLLSHLRIYDRWIRVGRAKLHIAGVGNVITALDARGRGYSGQIIQAMLPALQQEGYSYSLLWTHLPNLYGRYGWVPIEQELVRAVLPPSVLNAVRIAPFEDDDLPAIMGIYETANAERTGTTIRTLEYWLEQPTWLHETRDNFLVAHDNAKDVVVGYVRGRITQNAVEILELGMEGDRFDIGRTLLAAISMHREEQLQGQFPPSLRGVFLHGEFGIIPEEAGLMGRVINLAELLQVMEPVWRDRVREAETSEGVLWLATSSGHAVIQVTGRELQMDVLRAAEVREAVVLLNEDQFAHLLFHGFDERADHIIGEQFDRSFLRALFPEQDFVIWAADAF